ncbi:MFS monosaccharide transporter [Ramaria rubella]|nr:MFS monosaccharide transporter [Ramaria rubella]
MLHYTQLPTDSEGSTRTKHTANGGTLVTQPNGKYTYAYGAPGLKGLLHNSFAFRCSLFASLGGLTFGYDQGVIANVLVMKDFVSRWPIGPWEKGLMTAVLELGALIGALIAGILVDRLSRRGSICFACVVFCVGSAFQCFANSISSLTLGRAIGGLGIGALSMLSPLYIGEISAPESRGALLALEQLGIVLGVVLGFWFGFLTRSLPGSSSWRLPLGIQILPGILLGVGCLFLPPSPRLLVHQGKTNEALDFLAQLRFPKASELNKDDPLLQIEFLEMQVDAAMVLSSHKDGLRSEAASWAQLFNRKYLRRTLLGMSIMFWQQWSGINALLYYGPSLIQRIGFNGDSAILIGSGFINIAQFVAVIPTILYIDRLELITQHFDILTGGAAAMGSSHALISLLVWSSSGNWASHKLSAWISLGGIYLFTVAYGVSYGPIAWVLTSEVFPLSVRSKGVSISTASNWLNNFLIGLITPAILEISAAGTYLMFSLACFAACVWAIFLVPETAGVSLEEIDKVFNSSAGREDTLQRTKIEEELGLRELLRQHMADDEENM